MQKLATPVPGETANHTNARQTLYRNAALCILGQINSDPGRL